MRKHKQKLLLSASDLVRFTECAHATRLDMARLEGEGPTPSERSEDAELTARYGDAHEAAYRERMKAEGRQVTRIETQGASFEDAVAATEEAMRAGCEVIYQGAFKGSMWGGYVDFLERVSTPSALGEFSYEVVDTKLKQTPHPTHVFQIVLYSDLLAATQGRAPEQAHLELGAGERFSLRLVEVADYALGASGRLEAFVASPSKTRPVPCAACDMCRWRDHCGERWKKEDSLHQVAGITKSQVGKLEAASIYSMAALAQSERPVRRLAEATLHKLRTQAHLQNNRKEGEPSFVLREHVPGKGFDLMPQPDQGDLFYDIEGDPFYREGGVEGLEYLHGVWSLKRFTALWAHDLAEEKENLKALFDLFEASIKSSPGAHIYHYAPYEITALRRLTTRHTYKEAQFDGWLREKRFVDLYAVVRGGVFASEASYSLKDMEAFYDLPRLGEVTTSGGSVVAYEKWRMTGDSAVLADLKEYNRLDCISNELLRDWLTTIRPEGPWRALGEAETDASDAVKEQHEQFFLQLDAADLQDSLRRLLKNLGVFHWREAKPAAWAVYDALGKDFDDLCDDMDCLGGLVATAPQWKVMHSVARPYEFPLQESKLRSGARAQFSPEYDRFYSVAIEAFDRKQRTITLKIGTRNKIDAPDFLDLLPNFAINPKPIPEAIRTTVLDQCGARSNRAAHDLLRRQPPRFRGPSPLVGCADVLDRIIAAARAMDATVLPIQGPPGTGKTYVAARAIIALVGDGKRVAVTSNSHAAIRNVLKECVDALNDNFLGMRQERVMIAHKVGRDNKPLRQEYAAIMAVTENTNPALASAHIVGGTAWLLCREDTANTFDYLFVDEAGQVSLANLVGMSNCARNIVLVGDPRQLPQVIQGAHPSPANLSCLDWTLGESRLVEDDRGIFLSFTWRMHPALCRYISSQFYEGKLQAHPSTAHQGVSAAGVPRAGAFRMEVSHEGCAQVCEEEVGAVKAMIERLLQGEWTDKHGTTRPMLKSDLIVVAPYNAQVNALSDALPDVRVGTVDRFQGQEAPVALVSMTASSAEETTRGIDFLLSRERLNVAMSRGKALSIAFASPRLLSTRCSTVEQMRLVNALCALPEL